MLYINSYFNKIKNIIDKTANGANGAIGGAISADGAIGVDGAIGGSIITNSDNDITSVVPKNAIGGSPSDALRDSYNTNKAKIIKLLTLYYISASLPEVSSQGFDIITGISLAPIIPENLDETINLLKKTVFNELKTYLINYDFAKPGKNTNKLPSFDNFVKKLGLSEKTGDFITQMPTPGIMQQPQNTTMNILQNLKKVILTDIGLLYQITLTASEISNISAAFLRIVNSEKITFNTLQLFNTGLIFLNKVKNLSDQQVDYDDADLLEKYEYVNNPELLLKIYNQIYIETIWQQYSEYKKKKREGEIINKLIDWLRAQIQTSTAGNITLSDDSDLSSDSDSDTDSNNYSPKAPIKTKQFRDNLVSFLEQNSPPKKAVESKSFIHDIAQALVNAGINLADLENILMKNLYLKLNTDLNNAVVEDEVIIPEFVPQNKNMPIWFVDAGITPSRINTKYLDKFYEFIVEKFKQMADAENSYKLEEIGEIEANDANEDIKDIEDKGDIDIKTKTEINGNDDALFFDNFNFFINIIINQYLLLETLIYKYEYSVYLYLDIKYVFILNVKKASHNYKYEPNDILFMRKYGRNIAYLDPDVNYFTNSKLMGDAVITTRYNYLAEYEKHGAKLFKQIAVKDDDDFIMYNSEKIYYKKANASYFMYLTQTFNHFRELNRYNRYSGSITLKNRSPKLENVICVAQNIYELILNTLIKYYVGVKSKNKVVANNMFSLRDFIANEDFPLRYNGKTILDEITIDDNDNFDKFLKDLIIKYDISKDYYKISPKLIISSYLYNYSFLPNEDQTAQIILHTIIRKLFGGQIGGDGDDVVVGDDVRDDVHDVVVDDVVDGDVVVVVDGDDVVGNDVIIQHAGSSITSIQADETIALMLCQYLGINISINNKVFNCVKPSIIWVFVDLDNGYKSYLPSKYNQDLYNNTLENYLELKRLYSRITLEPNEYVYKKKLHTYLSKNLLEKFNKLPSYEIDEDNIIVMKFKLMRKILKLLRIHHLIFVNNEQSIISSLELIITKLANCHYDYNIEIIIYVKKVLVEYTLLQFHQHGQGQAQAQAQEQGQEQWGYFELNKLPLINIIALLCSQYSNNINLSRLRLKHYLKVGIDGSKELIPGALPKFVHSSIPALSKIIPGNYPKGINGGYREVILNFLSLPINNYFIEKSGVLTNFEYIAMDGKTTKNTELFLQIATELLVSNIQPQDFTRYPLDYIYSWHKETYFGLYSNGITTEIYNALVLAEYFMVQIIIKKSKMTIFSDEPGDFINDYQEIIAVMHDCFADIEKLDKTVNPNVDIYDYIKNKLS